MSDEPPPPPLRLKPRERTEPEASPTSPPPEPAAETTQKLRLKPKLFATPEPPGDAPSAPPAPPQPEPSAPNVTAPSAAPAAADEDAPRARLKVKQRDPAAAGSEQTPKRNTPPPFPVVAPPIPPPKKFPPPPRVPYMRAPTSAESTIPGGSPPAKPRSSSKKTLFIALAVILFIGGVAVYRFVLPAHPNWLSLFSSPALSAKLNQVAAAPGAAVNKSQDAVTARRANEQNRLDALVSGNDAPDQRALATPPPSALAAKIDHTLTAVPSTAQLAPGVTAITTTEVGGSNANAAFRTWVANARINGVFQGNPARALINGRTVRVGQVVDDVLGITFDGFNIEEKTIVFRDRSGQTVTRKF